MVAREVATVVVAWVALALAECCLQNVEVLHTHNIIIVGVARLLGGAKALRDSIHTEVDIADRPDYERTVGALRSLLGEHAFASAYEQGRAISFEQIIAHAQAASEESEREVLALRNGGDVTF